MVAVRTLGRLGSLTSVGAAVHGEASDWRRAMSLEETLSRFQPGAVDFVRELFDHHWSEAAWLYSRREVLDVQGKLFSLDQWGEMEARAEAHVVALSRGGRLVVDECESRAKYGDSGELHTAVRVLCRGDHARMFDGLVNLLDWKEPAPAAAVADAVAWDAPERWQELVAEILIDEATPSGALGPLASATARRGWPLGDLLVGVLEDRVGDLVVTADAVARLRFGEAWSVLSELTTTAKDPEVRQAAAIGALHFDTRSVAAYLAQIVGSEPWAAVPLAMAAGPEAFPVLVAALERSPRHPEILLGLGMLGHVATVPLLLDALADDGVAAVATEALYIMTGADLHEETTVVDEPDEDAEPGIGLLVVQLPRSRERWAQWLEEHGFAAKGPHQRLRLGAPFDPLRVLEELGRTNLRPELREAMATEISIRYQLPRAYSSRLPVPQQRKSIARLGTALAERPRLGDGTWVIDGRALPSHGPRSTRRP